ncbi:MAG: hypothetical protein EXR71_02010 [Myxococcales bacterium]|nr:hypothetical protein [Myxococcales bacterium]
MTPESHFTTKAAYADTHLDLTLLERVRRPHLADDQTWRRVTAPVSSRPRPVAPERRASSSARRRQRQWRVEAIVSTCFTLVCAALLGVVALLGVAAGVLPPLVAGALVLGGLLTMFGAAVIVLLALA